MFNRINSWLRSCLYKFVRHDFYTALMREFLKEMLNNKTTELKWHISANYVGGSRDDFVMTVKLESFKENSQDSIDKTE